MAKLEIKMFGILDVKLDGTSIASFRSTKAKALFAYLVHQRSMVHPRDSLAAMFRPDVPNQRARGNLRADLAHLRNTIKDRSASPPFLLVTRDAIQFNADSDYWLDTQAFVEGFLAAESGRIGDAEIGPHLSRTNRLYGGEFPAGMACRDALALKNG